MYDPGRLVEGFEEVLIDILLAVAPMLLLFAVAQMAFLRLGRREVLRMGGGFIIATVGLLFFLQGVHVTFIPLGQDLGATLMALELNWWLVPIGFALGFVATIAEPAVRILNDEVQKVSVGTISRKVLLITLSVGVGLSVAIAMIRTLADFPLVYILIPGYVLALLATAYVDETFVAIAFDAGGVATGPMTVTFIVALGVGVAADLGGRDPLIDGFGIIALVALTPILSVLGLGLLYAAGDEEDSAHDG